MAKWIAKANIKQGALTAQAKRAGKSLSGFMEAPGKNASTTTKRRIALARTFRKWASRRRGKKRWYHERSTGVPGAKAKK